MRLIASFLLCSVALNAGAADIWRWTDADGVVHFSDQPRPGAVKVNLGPISAPSGNGPRPEEPPAEAASEPERRRQSFAYTSCVVQSPENDQTFSGVQAVTVILGIEPQLQDGHRVQVYVNGALNTDWPPEATSFTLPEVFRGSHTIQARIVDSANRVLCNVPTVTFHLQQTGLNSPQSPLRPRPAPRPQPPVPTPRPAPGAPVG